MKTTNRALFTSVVALLLCCSMLVGTTFAWFTDSVTSSVNQIVAGNLDVDVLTADGSSIQNLDTLFNEVTLWEPGAVAYENLTVVNNGNLALKYELAINFTDAVDNGNGKTLADVLQVGLVPGGVKGNSREDALSQVQSWLPLQSFIEKDELLVGETDIYGIVIYWAPSANDNEFNMNNGQTTELSIKLGVHLFATQYTHEQDSFDNKYDEDAPVLTDKWDGTADTSWYNDTDTEFILTTAEELAGLAELVDGGNNFAGKTVKLGANINLYHLADGATDPTCFDPIGSYRKDKIFEGTFDGQGHTIANMNQNTWALDNGYYYTDCGLGLFGAVENATIKDLIMDNASISGESALCGTIAAVAGDNVTFENITVKNSEVADYQYYAGGIVGWAGGDEQFINCVIDASTTIGAQWGEFNNANGGVIGGVSTSAAILMKDCTVACRIDAFNDVTSAYEWYSYRRSGMLIGDSGQKDDPNGDNVGNAIAPNLTCENVTVIYGDWANYHYCQFETMRYPWVRVEAGTSTGVYSNPRYGHPTDANGNEVVDENHVHNDGEKHNELIVFDQLYGGTTGDRYCTYGTATHEGVTVIYDVSDEEGLKAALEAGKPVTLENDITITETLSLDTAATINLDGHNLTVSRLEAKGDVAISNGTVTHGESDYPALSVTDGGKLTMNNVKVVSNNYCNIMTSGSLEAAEYVGIQIFDGSCVLTDCDIEVTVDKERYINSAYGVAIHGGTLVMNGGSIKVTSPGSSNTQGADYQAAFASWQSGEKTITLNGVTIHAKSFLDAGDGNTVVNTTDAEGTWDGKCNTINGTYVIKYNP